MSNPEDRNGTAGGFHRARNRRSGRERHDLSGTRTFLSEQRHHSDFLRPVGWHLLAGLAAGVAHHRAARAPGHEPRHATDARATDHGGAGADDRVSATSVARRHPPQNRNGKKNPPPWWRWRER